jgi:hypothetical protein
MKKKTAVSISEDDLLTHLAFRNVPVLYCATQKGRKS